MLKTSIKDYVALKKAELKEKTAQLDIPPVLLVIQVGDNPASNSYIAGKKRDCAEVGVIALHVKLSEEATEDEIIDLFYKFDCDGIIVQLPLPKHINVKNIQRHIPLEKDVDGFRAESPFEPCTPLGIINYLKYNDYQFEGKDALVIGRSDIVGKTLARMLTDLDCTVTLAHSKTVSIVRNWRNADIIFTCIDKIEHFKAKNMPAYADVVDIGLGRNAEGKLAGNVADASTRPMIADRFTISGTGGVGLLTRLALLENVCKAAFDEDVP